MSILKYGLLALSGVILLAVLAVTVFIHTKPFGQHPSGERLARIERSANYLDGKFHNRLPTEVQTTDKPLWKIWYDFLFQHVEHLVPSRPLPVVRTDLQSLPTDKNFIVWFGHSSYLIQLDGTRFLVDPVLVSGSPLSFANKMFPGTDAYQPSDMPQFDYLVITHDHWDHLDYDAVLRLQSKMNEKVITSLGVGAHLEYWGYPAEKIIELDWQDEYVLTTGFKMTALPARHFSGRGIRRNKTLWASFMLETPTETVYIGGDSGYDPIYREIGERYDITLALLENGQYNRDWANIHIMPEQLVQAVKELHPKRLMTVHNSKFALGRHDWRAPLQTVYDHAREAGFNLFTPKIGEVFYFSEDGEPDSPKFRENWWKDVEK